MCMRMSVSFVCIGMDVSESAASAYQTENFLFKTNITNKALLVNCIFRTREEKILKTSRKLSLAWYS